MNRDTPSVFTISPTSGFLHVLARAVLSGFPLLEGEEKPPLSQWTILLPTRRAARELTNILAELSDAEGLVMPRIKPIGDLDEDRLSGNDDHGDLPKAISRTGQLFTLLSLLAEWAKDNPQISLAQEIVNSHAQSLGLATSLLKLLTQVETEEVDFGKIDEAYDIELSEHRNAVLSLIGLIKVELPKRLATEELMSPTERRSRLIRLEAARISEGVVKGPIIAAGSTGTIPATRALLKAISLHDKGAIVLPGLELIMETEAWQVMTPEHPQFSLKALIGELGVERSDVQTLGPVAGNRNWLATELMRPALTAERWHEKLKNRKNDISQALENVHLVEAQDRHCEARSIALILRETLELPYQKAALVTPDRDLARRVKAEMMRWNIVIDDSAGEPLVNFGLASLTARLLQCAAEDFTPTSIFSLLSHPDCNLGIERHLFLRHLRNLEIVVLRGYGRASGLGGISIAYKRAILAKTKKQRSHDLVAALDDQEWSTLGNFIQVLVTALQPLGLTNATDFQSHLNIIKTCVEAFAAEADQNLPENIAFASIMAELQSESRRHPKGSFAATSVIVLHMLRNETLRQKVTSHPRLAIYGVLEARLIPADIVILGGLNEGKWPAQPDPGPWLNRRMRTIFGMQQPEREIGVSAHDFTQGFGQKKVYLTWSKRIESSPQIPSRWILRLQNVLQAGGVEIATAQDQKWAHLAKTLDDPLAVIPFAKPIAKPPLSVRPTRFSVSSVEQLIRDPYAIYASKILRLNPLPPFAQHVDAPLRGTLFHEAIDAWNQLQPEHMAGDSLALLIEQGHKAFSPLMSELEVSSFWWPCFKRMASWLVEQEIELRKNTYRVFAESAGNTEFDINGISYSLYARADRIDFLHTGNARIIDYKTGLTPSNPQVITGMKPQLPLEAAILALKGFAKLSAAQTEELIFLKISGTKDEGQRIDVKPESVQTLTELGIAQFDQLKALLRGYQNPDQPYYPRANMFKEDDVSDYDHLSRYAEWNSAGEA